MTATRTNSSHALLVIDMQLVAFDGEVIPPVSDGTRLLADVSKLVRLCRRQGMPIVYAQTSAAPGHPYARDVHGWEIHPRLEPQPDDRVVLKPRSSAFDDTDLADVLRDLGVTTIITCGVWSEFCVTNTSLDATRLGYRVLVAADAHGTVASSVAAARSVVERQNHRLSKQGLTVLTIDDLTRDLETTAAHMDHR